MNKNRQHSSNLNFSTIMKKVLFTAALLFVAGFTFAQEKSVKEAKKMASAVHPDFDKAEELINLA